MEGLRSILSEYDEAIRVAEVWRLRCGEIEKQHTTEMDALKRSYDEVIQNNEMCHLEEVNTLKRKRVDEEKHAKEIFELKKQHASKMDTLASKYDNEMMEVARLRDEEKKLRGLVTIAEERLKKSEQEFKQLKGGLEGLMKKR